MAKSKSSFSLTAILTLLTSVLGVVMFFLPNFYYSGTLTGTATSSGLNMFTGVFSLDGASAATNAMYVSMESLQPVYNALAYIIGILFVLSAICLLACVVLSLLKILGIKVNYSLVGKIAMIASILLLIVLVLALIRFGQVNTEYFSLAFGYGFIVALISAIATAILPLALKD
ncbi:MAG: hypothetical protein ACI4TX_02455 [Christensenellales bacterium]